MEDKLSKQDRRIVSDLTGIIRDSHVLLMRALDYNELADALDYIRESEKSLSLVINRHVANQIERDLQLRDDGTPRRTWGDAHREKEQAIIQARACKESSLTAYGEHVLAMRDKEDFGEKA